MRTLTVPRTAPRDLFRRSARILTGRQAPGVVPGELVTLRFEGRPGLVPGFVYCVHYGDDVVIVDEDQ